jgi:sensor histidine kinase YesM
MQGPLASRRGATLYLLVWLMLGLVFAALVVGATGANWSSALWFAVPVTLVYASATGFSTYYLCRAYPLSDKPVPVILLVFGFSAIASGLLWTVFCIAWDKLWLTLGPQPGLAPTAMIFALGVTLYGLSAVAQYLANEFQRGRDLERRALESRLMAQDAELRMLRTQIDPHFLFNSLNSISALTSQNPAGARQMTLQLAEFFRHSLALEAHRKVTVGAEALQVLHFLAIEKVRFGARLMVEQDIGKDAAECLLPPMILQPLVENAVKHGIGNLTGGGVVRITAQRRGSMLHIGVDNDIDADMAQRSGAGIGLANVRQRLAAAYGHEASVHCSCVGNLFRVELALPAQTKET